MQKPKKNLEKMKIKRPNFVSCSENIVYQIAKITHIPQTFEMQKFNN